MATLGNPLGGGGLGLGGGANPLAPADWASQWSGAPAGQGARYATGRAGQGYGGYGSLPTTATPAWAYDPSKGFGGGGFSGGGYGGYGGYGPGQTTPPGWTYDPQLGAVRPPDQAAAGVPPDYAAWLKEHPGANAPDPGGGTVGSGGASAPAAGAAPPPPPQAGQPGANLFSGYDDLGQLYWNQNPGQAWAHAWSQLGPNVASPYWNWGMQQQSRYNDQYLAQAALPNNAMMTFTDFINQNAPGFRNTFDNLPASQRGVTNQYLAAGRLG